MRFLSLKQNVMLGAALSAAVLTRPLAAQEAFETPAGWTKSGSAGDLSYAKPDGSRFVAKPLSALGGDFRGWFDGQVARDGARRGQVVSSGQVKAQPTMLSQLRTFRGAQGAEMVAYLAHPRGNRGRLLVISAPNERALIRSLGELKALGRQIGQSDAAMVRAGNQGATGGNRVPVGNTAGGKLAPVAARGTLKASQVLGLYLKPDYTTGVGGMMIMEYNPVLMLRDGSARRNLKIPPQDINLAGDKRASAKDWGRWTKSGAKFVVRWADGRKEDFKGNLKTRSAPKGRTLNDRFSTIGGGGNTALGGSVMTFYSNEYRFFPNGSFTAGRSGGGSSSNQEGANVTAVANSANAGRYRLDGYALTLRFGDGRVVRRLFYFYPDSYHVVGIGDSTFIGDDKSK